MIRENKFRWYPRYVDELFIETVAKIKLEISIKNIIWVNKTTNI